MKLTKLQIGLIIAAVFGVVIFGFSKRKKMTGVKLNNFGQDDAKRAIKAVKKKYGEDVAILVEKLMRLETSHFRSDQYKKTGSGGMEIGGKNKTYPYGWKQPVNFWESNPQYKPIGIYTRPENQTGIKKSFIVFPTVTAAALTLADILRQRNYNLGSWFSTNPTLQQSYNNAVKNIRTPYATS